MRSGTNQYHAKAYEFKRNDAFDFRDFFKSLKAKRRMDEFGFAGGGPDHSQDLQRQEPGMFFYGAFEHNLQRLFADITHYTVPTPAMKTGESPVLLSNT